MKSTRPTFAIEPLEARIAPATFVNHSTISYHDMDGDLVTVKLSKPLLGDLATANQIFHFDVGAVVAKGTPDLTPQQLQLIDFSSRLATAAGVGVAVTVELAGDGDGFANVGRIEASGANLGVIAIKGDLGGVNAGDSKFTTAGVKSLAVQSIGQFGTSTQAAGGNLVSNITGALGTLTVKSDIIGGFISVAGDGTEAANALASIGKITIGGSLRGTAVDDSGQISATGRIGTGQIGGDLAGGEGTRSGAIRSGGKMGAVTIGGSLLGGIGVASDMIVSTGTLVSEGKMGAVKIGQDIRANDYALSGSILAGGPMASLTVGGSVMGGAGTQLSSVTGDISQITVFGSISAIKIGGDLAGGSGEYSGTIHIHGDVANITIGGSLLGGVGPGTPDSGFGSGSIIVDGFGGVYSGVIKIGGDVKANSFDESGKISGVASLSIGGSVVGGVGSQAIVGLSAQIRAGTVTVGGDVHGGFGESGAAIDAHTVKVRGSVIGGSGNNTASFNGPDLTFGSLTIGGNLRGGEGDGSASARSYSSVKIDGNVIGGGLWGPSGWISNIGRDVTIGGSLIGGFIESVYGKVTIGGSVIGGESNFSGRVSHCGTIIIGGSLIAGAGIKSGSIDSSFLESLTIRGSVVGTAERHAIISVDSYDSSPSSLNSKRNITVLGDVQFGEIIGTSHTSNLVLTGNGQLGAIKIGGDFIASSIAVSAQSGPNGYGSGDVPVPGGDSDILATIASITIRGQVLGTIGGTDHYGIVAERIKSLEIGGNLIPLNPGAHNDSRPIGTTGDLTIDEI